MKVDEWFYNQWRGDFTTIYDYSTTANHEEMNLKNFKNLIYTINQKLEIAKMSKFKHILAVGKCVIDIDYGEEELCKSCGRYVKQLNIEEDRCEQCNSMFALGSKLIKESIIVFRAKNGNVNYFNKLYISIIDSLTSVRDFIVAYTLNEEDMIPSAKRGLPLLNINNYVPQHNGTTLTFEEIANSSLQRINKQDHKEQLVGTTLLAYIKAYVDNMGFIFGYGIDDLSISRYVSLSRMLHIFFNLVVKDLIKTKYKNIYTVLSGGDDLFVIAPWTSVSILSWMLKIVLKNLYAKIRIYIFQQAYVYKGPIIQLARLQQMQK